MAMGHRLDGMMRKSSLRLSFGVAESRRSKPCDGLLFVEWSGVGMGHSAAHMLVLDSKDEILVG